MSFEQKPNKGSATINKFKKSSNHPDMRGDIFFDRSFLRNMLDKTDGDLVQISIAVWNNTSKAGNPWLSFEVSEPYVKKEEAPKEEPKAVPTEDEDVPF